MAISVDSKPEIAGSYARLEEKILEQIRSSTKLIDRVYARRRKAIPKA